MNTICKRVEYLVCAKFEADRHLFFLLLLYFIYKPGTILGIFIILPYLNNNEKLESSAQGKS